MTGERQGLTTPPDMPDVLDPSASIVVETISRSTARGRTTDERHRHAGFSQLLLPAFSCLAYPAGALSRTQSFAILPSTISAASAPVTAIGPPFGPACQRNTARP